MHPVGLQVATLAGQVAELTSEREALAASKAAAETQLAALEAELACSLEELEKGTGEGWCGWLLSCMGFNPTSVL